MLAGVSQRILQCAEGPAAVRLCLAAPAPVLTVVSLCCEFRGTMLDVVVRLRGFLRGASADQGMAGQWRGWR